MDSPSSSQAPPPLPPIPPQPPSPLLSCQRYLKRNVGDPIDRCADHHPRTCAIACRVFLPVFFLMFLSLIGGNMLAALESPEEYKANDFILANRYLLDNVNLDDYVNNLLELPSACLIQTLNRTSVVDNITLYDLFVTPDSIDNLTALINIGSSWLDGSNFDEEQADEDLIDALSFFLTNAQNLTNECISKADRVINIVEAFDNVTDAAIATDDMTFNWIFCVNESSIVTYQDLLDRAQNQDEHYEYVWNESRIEWFYRVYDALVGNITVEDPILSSIVASIHARSGQNLTDEEASLLAFTASLYLATGQSTCQPNSGGSVWFFFTIMTTIGYGNQAPITQGGRIVVVVFGFVSIIAFAAILTNTGDVLDVLYDDAVKRLRVPSLRNPKIAMLVFGILATGWLILIAFCAHAYWQTRLPEDESVPTPGDSIWFAYISILTVGLGDLYFQPEYMGNLEAVGFSFLFLFGFVLLAAFLTQLSDCCRGPDWVSPGERLRQRIEKTYQHNEIDNSNPDEDHSQTDPSQKIESAISLESKSTLQQSNDRIVMLLDSLSAQARDCDKSISTLHDEQSIIQEILHLKEAQIKHLDENPH